MNKYIKKEKIQSINIFPYSSFLEMKYKRAIMYLVLPIKLVTFLKMTVEK